MSSNGKYVLLRNKKRKVKPEGKKKTKKFRVTNVPDTSSNNFFTDVKSPSSEESDVEFSLNDTVKDEQADDLNYKFYKNDNVWIGILKNNVTVYFDGAFKLRVISGRIDAYGYEIKPSNHYYEMYSLKGWPQLYLKHVESASKINVKEKLKSLKIKEDTVNKIFDEYMVGDAIICCVPLNKISLRYADKCASNTLLPFVDKEFSATFNNQSNESVLQIPDKWHDVDCKEFKDVMLCGGKSVGKSTLLRFMINKCLSFHQSVFVVDLDPGQSEFTMSGCMSVVEVKEPLFGPNFTHQADCGSIKLSVVQSIDVSSSPKGYITNVELLKQFIEENVKNSMILINCMGHTKDIGLRIMFAVISIFKPNILIEIKSQKDQKNFSRDLLHSTATSYDGLFKNTEELPYYELITLPTAYNSYIGGFKPPSYLCRDINTFTYFGSALNGSLSLLDGSIPLYKIELNQIKVYNSEFNLIDDNLKAAVINCNIVALCCPTDSNENRFKTFGYGLVRAVTKIELFLFTPIDYDKLKDCTCLIVGLVQTPSAMLINDLPNTMDTPYVSSGCLNEFIQAPKRSYIPRKSM